MYRVRWFSEADDALAALWLAGDSGFRRTLNTHVNEMEKVLSADPFGESESRDADERILLKPPLAILFDVDEAASTVWVADIWRY